MPFRAYRVNFRINESARFICGGAVVQSAPAHLTVSVRPSNGTTGANVTHFMNTIRPIGRASIDPGPTHGFRPAPLHSIIKDHISPARRLA